LIESTYNLIGSVIIEIPISGAHISAHIKIHGSVLAYIYRMSVKWSRNGGMQEVKENKKVLYHLAIFAIVNELLICKNHRISPAYCLMQARDAAVLQSRLLGAREAVYYKRQWLRMSDVQGWIPVPS